MNVAPSPFLTPFSWLYGLGVSLRNWGYDQGILPSYHSTLPVVCVGNATAGGSGKSPFVDYLVEHLLKTNRRPVILSRGYGGEETGPTQVVENSLASQIGDESLMHFRAHGGRVPVVVSASRAEGVKFIEVKHLGDIVLLDDGYQHRALSRSLNLLLLDVSSENSRDRWLHGNLLPAGYLREPLEIALKRATAAVFMQKSDAFVPSPERILPENLPGFRFVLKPDFYIDVFNGETISLRTFSGKPGAAMSAIADCLTFFDSLRKQGIALNETFSFADHHQFAQEDWKAAEKTGRTVFCTEKDAVKLSHFLSGPGQLYALRISGGFSSPEAHQTFWSLFEPTKLGGS